MQGFSFEEITTKDFLEGMTKGVLGTHYLQPDKFPLFFTDPPVGRTFVADRLKKEYPIDLLAAEKLYVLYKHIFEGGSNYELIPLTERFSRQFSVLLDVDIEFLRMYNDDTVEMKQKKEQYLIMIWKNVVDRFIDKKSISLGQFQNNRFTLLSDLFMKMKTVCTENTYTKDVMEKREKKADLNINQGLKKQFFPSVAIPLFIYGYAGAMGQLFLAALLDQSRYIFEPVRMLTDRTYQANYNVMPQSQLLFLSKDEFDEKESKKELFHIRTCQMEEHFREAYSKVLIDHMLEEGIGVCILGSLKDFRIFREVFPCIQSVLVLPSNVENAICGLGERQSDPGAVKKHFRYLNREIKNIMEEDKNALVFFADADHMQETVNSVESHLLLMRHSLEYNREALKRYTHQVSSGLSNVKFY